MQPINSKELILYSREPCELCEQAQLLLAEVMANILSEELDKNTNQPQWIIKKINIDSDPVLLEKYAWHIPVLQRSDNNAELFWPFPKSRLRTFLFDL